MLKKYCDIIGANIPEKECKELQPDNFDDCKDCESVLESGLTAISKEIKEKTIMKKKTIEPAEPVCVECSKKASEVAKFNLRTNTCNACYQKEYRIKQGPRIRKRKKEGDTPPRGVCAPDIKEPVQAKEWEETGTKRPGDGLRVVLDFTEHPDMYDELMALAKNEMRSPAAQIFYLLRYGNFDALKH